jgi:hypothetical protein
LTVVSGPERAAVLEVLLDLAVLVVGLNDRCDAAGVDLGLKDARGRARDLAIKDDLHAVGASERRCIRR